MAHKVVRTHYIPPTNQRGARIGVASLGTSKVLTWDTSLNDFQNHQAAALKFCPDWTAEGLMSGQMRDGSWVHMHRKNP